MFSPAVAAEAQQHLLRAQACLEEGQAALAIAPLRRALALMPVLAEPHYHLATALQHTGDPDGAIAQYRLAIRYAGEQGRLYPDAHMGLGSALALRGDREDSRAAYADAIRDASKTARDSPRSTASHMVLGMALMKLCRFEEALKSFQTAMRLDRKNTRLRGYAAQVLCYLGRYKAAIALCDETLAGAPGDATAHVTRGIALIALGRWKSGLDEYRWRWAMKEYPSPRFPTDQPLWTGQDVSGRTVLVYWEQGNGDVVQFCRFAGMLGQRGATVLAYVTPALSRLVASVPGVTRCYSPEDSGLPSYDFVAPFMNLAQYFIGDDDTLPVQESYVLAPAQDIQRWKQALVHLSGFRIGLVWAGRASHMTDLQRSAALSDFAPLAGVSGVNLVSLQQGPRAMDQELAMFRPGNLTDFADTAALIDALDLVITVDTAVAHVAGAMGKPVWIMLPFVAEWRWGVSGDTTPWYPSARLFRQTKPGDWAGVVRRMIDALETARDAIHA